jgi:hypothetical protein
MGRLGPFLIEVVVAASAILRLRDRRELTRTLPFLFFRELLGQLRDTFQIPCICLRQDGISGDTSVKGDHAGIELPRSPP